MKVSFTLEEEEGRYFLEYAIKKGLKLSALAKAALFQYAERYPRKDIEPHKTQKGVRAVQQHPPERNLG